MDATFGRVVAAVLDEFNPVRTEEAASFPSSGSPHFGLSGNFEDGPPSLRATSD
jgi:hypothetical protein